MRAALETKSRTSATAPPTFGLVPNGFLQRKCACGSTPGPTGECDACRKKRLQRKTNNGGTDKQNVSEIPPVVHEVLRSLGEPLDAEARAFMERRFGHDFSQVRVHTDASAARSAEAVNALAYAAGTNIVFGQGQYVVSTTQGKKLIAHELTHVLQQRDTYSAPPRVLNTQSPDLFEHLAEKHAEQIMSDATADPVPVERSKTSRLQRQPKQRTQTADKESAAKSVFRKTLTIVSWIDPTGLPDFSRFTIATSPESIRALVAVAMLLKCTANKRPPSTLRDDQLASLAGSKEYRAIQRYIISNDPVFDASKSSLQLVGFTAPSKCDCSIVPPCAYLPGEVSPLNYVNSKSSSFDALMKFRVSDQEETAALKSKPNVPVFLGGLSLEMLSRVPWVWTTSTGKIAEGTNKLAWFVSAAAFPTHTIYVDGAQVGEIPQESPAALIGSHIRTADKPRETMKEEEAQREVPVKAQNDTVRPGTSKSGQN